MAGNGTQLSCQRCVLVRLRGMDDPGMVEELYRIGKAAADKQVKPDHWTIA